MNTGRRHKGLLIADSTIDALAGYLSNLGTVPAIETIVAPFDQVSRVLLDDTMECWCAAPSFAVIWTLPARAVPSFNNILAFRNVPLEVILAEVDAFCSLVLRAAARVPIVFVPSWVMPTDHRGLGPLNLRRGIGVANVLMHMNLRLSERLDGVEGVYVLQTDRWTQAAGKAAFSPKLWYTTKSAFGLEVFREAAQDIAAALQAAAGRMIKLVIVDLDDTLWGGIVGEVGWENLRIGGHDPIGEAFADFQQALKALTNRGIVLAIASKNTEEVALEALRRHPEMVLRPENFVAWRINWNDKAVNILEIVRELRLGLDAVIFIDDSTVERDRVRHALPELFVPDWPQDKLLYRSALQASRCFDCVAVTAEDAARTQAYRSERDRQDAKANAASFDEWLEQLATTVLIEEWGEHNAQRTVQLLNKTNQMNLRTRRLTEGELRAWLEAPNVKLWTFRVSDRFGDAGLTAILSLEWTNDVCDVVDFVMSCRVLGRGAEETMLYTAVSHARRLDVREIRATYFATRRNEPCLRFFERSGWVRSGDDFVLGTSAKYPPPRHVKIVYPGEAPDRVIPPRGESRARAV